MRIHFSVPSRSLTLMSLSTVCSPSTASRAISCSSLSRNSRGALQSTAAAAWGKQNSKTERRYFSSVSFQGLSYSSIGRFTRGRVCRKRSSVPIEKSLRSPIHNRPIVQIVGFAVAPVVVNFVGEQVFVQFDAQTWSVRNVHVTLTDLEWLCDVAQAEAGLLLAKKVRDGSSELQARCQ